MCKNLGMYALCFLLTRQCFVLHVGKDVYVQFPHFILALYIVDTDLFIKLSNMII